MLLTLTPNPCLEKTFRVPTFAANGSFRIGSDAIHENVGGKGINAARVAARFGVRAVALAPLGPNLRDHLHHLAASETFELHGIEVEALTRTCHNVVSEQGSTELLEAGYELTVGDGTRLFQAWRDHLADAAAVLRTLREPDRAMAAAGDVQVWERMILAALGEQAG